MVKTKTSSRRQFKKLFRNTKKARRYYKKRGGEIHEECPVCFEEKHLLKMVHSGETYPVDETNTVKIINHKICSVCFERLNPKKCPLCRKKIIKFVDTDELDPNKMIKWEAPLAQ